MHIPNALRTFARRLVAPLRRAHFSGSNAYWEQRYRTGGSSGEGSYGEHAEFKARVLNAYVEEERIASVVELGCGDGHQLTLARYPRYLGLDVSAAAIERCISLFRDDRSKSFVCYSPTLWEDPAAFVRGEMTISLDVIFHLVEDEVFDRYMRHLFAAATRYVAIYSSNVERRSLQPHERHRRFTDWVAASRPDWALTRTVRNIHPFEPATGAGSMSDFYFFAPLTAIG